MSDLNDPCENLVDSNMIKEQLRFITKVFGKTPEVDDKYEMVCNALDALLSRKIGIFSLSRTYNDELLWAHYANAHKGFCIEFDLDILLKNQSIRKYYSYDVEYVDTPPVITIDDLNSSDKELSRNRILAKKTSTKSKRWASEEEIRIIADNPGEQAYDFRAVKSIYFGVRMEDSYKEMIMADLKGRGIKYYQMEQGKLRYSFHSSIVSDKYSDSAPYLYNISSVTEDAVREEDVTPEFKRHIPCLYKAIEIARRDPYCRHVYSSDFSISKSTPNQPVVIVTCEKSNDDYDYFLYSKDEIDRQYAKIADL